MTMRESPGVLWTNNPFLKVAVGYFIPSDGVSPPATAVFTSGKGEVTIARTGEGTWDVTVNDLCTAILHADFTCMDPDTLIHEVRPTAISGKVVSIRQREAANGTATVTADDTVARIQFTIWYVTDPNVTDGF